MNADSLFAELEDLGVHRESALPLARPLQSDSDHSSSENTDAVSMIEMRTRKKLIENYKHVISALDGLRSVLEEAKQTLEQEVAHEEATQDLGPEEPGTKEADNEEVREEPAG